MTKLVHPTWRRNLLSYSVIVIASLALCEVILQIAKPDRFTITLDKKNLAYRHDPDLGWIPVANSKTKFSATRTISVLHNEIGLRDASASNVDLKGSIMFIGDSFVWGFDVEPDERFTSILQQELPSRHIVNAGVSGYGTDQEYLLLQKLWDRVQPSVVVLVFCTDNDHLDNSTNKRGGFYKPYYVDGEFRGIPVPVSKSYLFSAGPLARGASHLMLARLAVSLYNYFARPEVRVPDPSDELIALMKRFVESRGAKFVVGIQYLQGRDPLLEASLQRQGIPYASFEGISHYAGHGQHWTPEGHAQVAKRLLTFFEQNGILNARQDKQSAAMPLRDAVR